MNSSRAKAAVAAAAVGALVATGVVVLTVARGEEPAPPQTSFCWGTLTSDDVSALGVEPRQEYTSREVALRDSARPYCDVADEFTLTVDSVISATDVWRTADEVAAESPFRAPIAGVPGWVNRSYAGVLLPAACGRELGQAGAPYLQLDATNDQEDVWKDGVLQKRMTDVLMKAAVGLTKELGCAAGNFASPRTAPRLLRNDGLDDGNACGLRGFSPLSNGPSGPTAIQYATAPDDFRLWSCAIGSSDDPWKGIVHFTATQDPRLVGLYGADSGGKEPRALLTCEGKPTLLEMGHFFGGADAPARGILREDMDLFEGFVEAVTDQAGCERP
ncbi:hypothetical protein [Streptomyces sp. NPDC005805]|uniref:hypothetical protein n=1 Tax=Streptomyces sp. NPDC005805 TaxID=3157068 RepID=UPI0033C619AC